MGAIYRWVKNAQATESLGKDFHDPNDAIDWGRYQKAQARFATKDFYEAFLVRVEDGETKLYSVNPAVIFTKIGYL